MKDDLRTFREWSGWGYKIKKGAKHVARNKDGVPLFSRSQVEDVSSFGSPCDTKELVYGKEDKPPRSGSWKNNRTGTTDRYEKQFGSWRVVSYYPDGGGFVHGSGPCGPLHFDMNGDT